MRDSSGGGERQLHRGLSLRTVEEERSLSSSTCPGRFKSGLWTIAATETPDPTDGLLESAATGESCAGATGSGPWEKEEEEEGEPDAVGKVTNYGGALLTESLQTVRTFQSHSVQLDAILNEPQRAWLVGPVIFRCRGGP